MGACFPRLRRCCRRTGGTAVLWLAVVAAAPAAHATQLANPQPPSSTHATATAVALQPHNVTKTPSIPARRPIADCAPLALLLIGLVALWRTAERLTFTRHDIPARPAAGTSDTSHESRPHPH